MVDEMKVTQGEQNKFVPITIVLETEEEAAILWAALDADVQAAAIENDTRIDISELGHVECQMFVQLDKAYNATEGKYAK